MILKVAKKECMNNLMDFKFFLILIISVVTFAASSLVLTTKYLRRQNEYNHIVKQEIQKLREKSAHLNQLLDHKQVLYIPPNPLEFVAAGNILFLPDSLKMAPLFIEANTMSLRSGQVNPLIQHYGDIDWIFIIGIILSFGAILFTHDSICGEKESRTLPLLLANRLSRHQILIGKFLGNLVTLSIPMLLGTAVNLLIISLYFQLHLSVEDYLKILFLLLTALIYLCFFLLTGIFVSSLFHKSITSFMVLFFVWVLVVIVIPLASGTLGSLFQPIMDPSQVQELQQKAAEDVARKYKETYGQVNFNQPFARETALWVEATNESHRVAQKIQNDRVREMLAQTRTARKFSSISPYSAFKFAAEHICASGLPRVARFFEGARQYRQTFLDFLVQQDRKDPDVPHLLFSYFFSRRAVNPKDIPLFKMPEYRAIDLVGSSLKYLFFLILCSILAFIGAYVSFLKYDVR